LHLIQGLLLDTSHVLIHENEIKFSHQSQRSLAVRGFNEVHSGAFRIERANGFPQHKVVIGTDSFFGNSLVDQGRITSTPS
jgi:hypothetical protein